jgi:signal transduction histidine kinase
MSISVDLVVLAQVAFTVCVILVLEGIAVYTWQFRAEPGARWHIWAQTCKCLWLAAIAAAMIGGSTQWSMVASRTTWFVAMASAYIWYRFIAELSGFNRSAPRWLEPAIRIGVLFSWLLYLTNPWHHLIAYESSRAGVLEDQFGVLCLFFTYPFGYSVNLLSAGLNVRWALRCRGLRRRQAWAFLVPNLFVWAGQFLSNMPWARMYDPHSIFFLLAGLTTAWAFFRWRSYSVLPLAQEAMVRSTIDALVVIDEEGYIVSLNQAARSIFPRVAAEGNRFESIAQDSPALLSLPEAGAPRALEANWEIAGGTRFFLVQTTPLHAAAGWLLGQVFCFRDITNEKAQQIRIVEQEKALAILAERERIGRELHDGRGQIWSYISMTAQALHTLLQRQQYAQAVQILDRMIGIVREQNLSFRESIQGLHGEAKTGLLSALEHQLDWYRQNSGLRVELDAPNGWRDGLLAPAAEAHLLRIVQESMVNIRKSSGATHVRVSLEYKQEQLCLCVADNGYGFEVSAALADERHHGLRIMRERALEIGGCLQIDSAPQRGTTIRLTVPLLRREKNIEESAVVK